MDKETYRALQTILRHATPDEFFGDAEYANAWDRAMAWMSATEKEILGE